ncbi:uncharacterized protein BDW43DRAFT_282527 [Aspergillus alliaceus]|uniref:uncharacterized protein n=1 Tax=Petromyces alliaceus TaxID=209559 RepID=UPI0012A47650|nr:uncharacterized protein BDW43DRAFT_282527 [Aspergillus alliaceus]KAB8231524.1 hypothetical protein BDW43DRAFT_282527 [Aspergillus alliaceus]
MVCAPTPAPPSSLFLHFYKAREIRWSISSDSSQYLPLSMIVVTDSTGILLTGFLLFSSFILFFTPLNYGNTIDNNKLGQRISRLF